MLSWSSGLGRHPLTVEIAGSTPAGSEYSFLLNDNLEVVRIFDFIWVCVVWIKISDFKRNLIMQIQVRIILDEIQEVILADEKIREEIMVDLLIHKIQKQKLYMWMIK